MASVNPVVPISAGESESPPGASAKKEIGCESSQVMSNRSGHEISTRVCGEPAAGRRISGGMRKTIVGSTRRRAELLDNDAASGTPSSERLIPNPLGPKG